MHLPSRRRFPPFARIAAAAFLAAAATAATPAAAEFVAYTTTSVNQRIGPGTTYDVIQTVPERTRIVVYGCLQPLDWCEVDFRGRGWMSSDYIQAYYQGAYYGLARVGAYLRVPIATYRVAQSGRPAGNVSHANFGVFYDRLSPYGHWVQMRGQYVWVPGRVSRDWQPYQDGRWVFTQKYGWTWVSNEPFGWATYHYGRWAFSKDVGWFWVPGTRWAPAWVAWRGSKDHVAWAPLPPEPSSGLSININIGTVPNYYWQVVPTSAFLSVNLNTAIVRDHRQTANFVQQSQPLGAVQVQGQDVVNNALDVKAIEDQTRQRVVARQITTSQDPQASGQVSDTTVQVFAPPAQTTTAAAEPAKPKQVTTLTQVEQESQTKGQAGNEPATDNLVVAPTAEQQPTANAPATDQQPATAEQQQPAAASGTPQACPQGTVLQADGSCAAANQSATGGAATPTAPAGGGPNASQEPPPPQSTTPSNAPPPAPQGGTAAGSTTEQPVQPPATTEPSATTEQPAQPSATTEQPAGTSQQPAQSGNEQACPKGTTLQADGSCAPKQSQDQAPASNAGSAETGGKSTEPPPPATTAPSTAEPPAPDNSGSSGQPAAPTDQGQQQSTDQGQSQDGSKQQLKCPDGQPAQADGSCPAQPAQ